VTFSKPINVGTFDYHDLTLTINGGTTNLITSAVTVAAVPGTTATYRVSGLDALDGGEGTYTFTVNGAGIQDAAGNAVAGAATASWVVDLTPPAAPTNLAITPDTGVSSTDGITNTGAVTLTGTLGEPGLRVQLYDVTAQADLGAATVAGTTFQEALSLSAGCTRSAPVPSTPRATSRATRCSASSSTPRCRAWPSWPTWPARGIRRSRPRTSRSPSRSIWARSTSTT
jgi:hypothetical protein